MLALTFIHALFERPLALLGQRYCKGEKSETIANRLGLGAAVIRFGTMAELQEEHGQS
jgi:hypothetical protein